jgi:hypothetical protein
MFQARFQTDACAAGITLTNSFFALSNATGKTTATKSGSASWSTAVLMSRPPPDENGCLKVTWKHTTGTHTMFGWAQPDLDPNTKDAYNTHGSFVYACNGTMRGLGSKGRNLNGQIPQGSAVSVRYDPARGTMYVRVDDDVEVAGFTGGMANNLVPAVILYDKDDSTTAAD